jgi:hypothetical protein
MSYTVTLMVRQAHHDNVILSLSKDVEGCAAFVSRPPFTE